MFNSLGNSNSVNYVSVVLLNKFGIKKVKQTKTNIDLELFLDHYDTEGLIYNCGWKFKSMTGIFDKYINKWIAEKNEGTITGNKGQRTRAKLMLNSLYGKFAKGLKMKSKIPFELGDDIIRFEFGEAKEVKGLYLPVSCFITSYARKKTIRN